MTQSSSAPGGIHVAGLLYIVGPGRLVLMGVALFFLTGLLRGVVAGLS